MKHRYMAFDIETAKVLPEFTGDLLAHRPLGISCAAAVFSDSDETVRWHGIANGQPSARMSPQEVQSMVRELCERVNNGYTLLSWNGLSFDLNVLAEESGDLQTCARLARGHVDMMFHVVCRLGHYIGLDKAAEGLGLPGKTAGVSGYDAPAMWAAGKHTEVISYNVQDAKLTLAIALESERRGELLWVTRKRTKSRMPIPNGWHSVMEAQALPLPDTSWMSDPPRREKFMSWFPQNLAD